MITSLSWIPKGASKAMPDAAETPSEEQIKELIHNGTLKKSTLSDMDEDDEIQNSEVAHAKAVAKSFGQPSSLSNGASSSSSTDADNVAKFLKELDMDNYDEEDDEIELFSSGQGDLYYPSNEMDPYLKDTNVNYDSEDLDDVTIRPTDSLVVCATVKDKVNYLEVYVCEDFGNGTYNMYLRHDIIISEVPLCSAWLDCPLKGGDKGNFVAVGSMDSSIEIWDLDLVDDILPYVQLGRIDGQTSDCHTDSVIGLAWNKEFRNMVASASADKKVKVWDVATGKCKVTMEHHKKEVQAVAWNHYTPEVLLSGSRDRTVVVKDGRDPSHSGLKWSTKAKVENLAWDPHSEHSFVASLKDGTVKGFDTRATDLTPSFTLHAHDGEVSSISYNIQAPNLLATGSGDESVKLWDLSNNQPSWIATHKPEAGIVFSVSFSADLPFLLAVGGSEGKLKVWDTMSDTSVSRRYGSNRP
ncbi:Dynein assembly factor with WD repeat domains 1 [Cardamine amara subsp. amara]|uniref:Dynein assembly factor with WD repeat domains 1 n=1 Tax=Cardamine amara subsp. amara TaxID=228776 RepID=A0ABD1BAM9_CARAN